MYVKLKEEFKIIEFIKKYMSQIEIRKPDIFNPFDEELEKGLEKEVNLIDYDEDDFINFKNNHYLLDNKIKNDEYKRFDEED